MPMWRSSSRASYRIVELTKTSSNWLTKICQWGHRPVGHHITPVELTQNRVELQILLYQRKWCLNFDQGYKIRLPLEASSCQSWLHLMFSLGSRQSKSNAKRVFCATDEQISCYLCCSLSVTNILLQCWYPKTSSLSCTLLAYLVFIVIKHELISWINNLKILRQLPQLSVP